MSAILNRKRLSFILLIILLCLPSVSFMAAAQDTPAPSGGFTTLSAAWFPGVVLNGTFTEIVRVFDFPTGTGTGLHMHGGPTLLSMIDGALTLRQNEVDESYGAWEHWTEMPDVVHEAFNDEATTARVVASYLVPEGAEPAVPQGEPNRPAGTKLYEAIFPDLTIDGMFTELVRVIDFPPNSGTGLHTHGGHTFLVMIEGALTLRQDGTDTVYEAGTSWMETPDVVHEAFNAGDTNARVIAVYLLPMAAPATLVQQ
jgi:quercetin dioxygenase-like cupin family protein